MFKTFRHVVTSVLTALAIGALVYGGNTSCGYEPCYAFSVVPGHFSDEDVESLRKGTLRFNEFVGIRRFELVPSGGCLIKRVAAPKIEIDGGQAPAWGGMHKRWLREIWIEVGERAGPVMERLIMHELGHASGMSHLTEDYDGIMSGGPCTDARPCAMDWTWADRNECEVSGICLLKGSPR